MLLVAQLLVAPQQPTYSSSALRDLVERASERNRAAPADLDAYGAQVESEIAVLTRRADGAEVAVSIEQAHNEVRWQRSGEYAQHVTGYRARQAGPSISALAVLKKAWTIPMLYGNRLSLFLGQDSATGPLRETGDGSWPESAAARKGTTLAVHPFAAQRDEVYHFTGGDTVAVIQTGERAVTVVRVLVEPRSEQAAWPVVVFRGEINVDAEFGDIVRMRGQFITLGQRGPQRQRLVVVPVSVKAFVDLESILVEGRYWLPRHQRIEQHVDLRGLSEGRAAFRIVSRFGNHRTMESSAGDVSLLIDEGTEAVESSVITVPLRPTVHRLTVASPDSLGRPRAWLLPLGEATATMRGDDFADLDAESVARPGSTTVAWRAQRLADLVHFNRVEGWTTGNALEVSVGQRLRVRTNTAWAWTERTVRGRLEAMQTSASGEWTAGARLGRTLDITNDFTAPYDSGGSIIEALAGLDRYDYVNRKAATLWMSYRPVAHQAAVRVEAGAGADIAAPARLTRGLWEPDVPFLPNRGVDEGTYARAALQAEWNSAVIANALVSGLGARFGYEAATGQLDWQRATLRLIAREEVGSWAAAARIDGGALFSRNAPPQQLFEVGGEPSLPGFSQKEFAGDRAIVTQWRLAYRLPVMRSPLRFLGCTCFTAPAPALAITLFGARLSASRASMASISRLGSVGDRVGYAPATPGEGTPLSRPSDGWRGSLEVGLRMFGGAATLGAVRVMDAGKPWRAKFSLGQAW